MATSTELYVVALALADYAHKKLTDHMKWDYERQLGRWRDHFNLMISAQEEAVARHTAVLKQAKDSIQQADQATLGLAMLAFSLVGGPLMHWVGAKIEHHWFPKFTGKLQERTRYIQQTTDGVFYTRQAEHYKEVGHNAMHAAIFGDVVKDAGNAAGASVIDKLIKPSPPNNDLINSANTAATLAGASSPADFRGKLERALWQQAEVTIDKFMSWANRILEDRRKFGYDVLEKLYQRQPHLRKDTTPKETLQDQGEAIIVEEINRKREAWANSGGWFYYANNPPNTTKTKIADNLEVELWALWVLEERLNVYTHQAPVEFGTTMPVTQLRGKTFGSMMLPEAVLRKLGDYGVVLGRTKQQRREEQARWIALREQKELEEKVKAGKVRPWNSKEGFGPPTQAELNEWSKTDWKKRREEQAIRGLQRAQELDSVHKATEDRPVIDVGKMVDTEAEILALETWAKKHQMMHAGRLTGTKRPLGSIRDVYAYSRR
jgi:hypothetical protein